MIIDPLGDNISSVELLGTFGNDKSIVNSARVSNGKDWETNEFTGKDYRLLKYLITHQHGSPFEHTTLQYRIKAPLFVHAQWVKHRAGTSINTQSGRYVEMEDQFYVPIQFRQQSTSNKQGSIDAPVKNADVVHVVYSQSIKYAYDSYQYLLDMGVAREQARGVLPKALYTQFVFTCNLRSLLHFLQLRTHEGAQYEIRRYADALARLAEPVFPHTFKALAESGGYRHI